MMRKMRNKENDQHKLNAAFWYVVKKNIIIKKSISALCHFVHQNEKKS